MHLPVLLQSLEHYALSAHRLDIQGSDKYPTTVLFVRVDVKKIDKYSLILHIDTMCSEFVKTWNHDDVYREYDEYDKPVYVYDDTDLEIINLVLRYGVPIFNIVLGKVEYS